jgi:molybdopterin-dependent oxidoreductase alpha subunit
MSAVPQNPPPSPDSASLPAALPPDDSAEVRVGAPQKSAGGLGAIQATMRHLQRQPGLLRGGLALLKINQSEGFDCPGCAWPEPGSQRAEIEFCENGAKAVAWETTRKTLDGAFFAAHSVADLAAQSDYWLGQAGRLVEPMLLTRGASHYRSISWDDAFALIGRELNSLGSADEAAFYTSGRTSNEAAFLYQLFVRQFGTNNLPDCSNMCHESSGVALKETLGVGKGTVQLCDFDLADAIFLIGQNPGTNHPRMLTTLQRAAERGCQIVSINPLPEAALMHFQHPQDPTQLLGMGTPISTLFLPVRVDGDAALLKGIMKEMLAEERRRPGQVFDWEFINAQTTGLRELIADLDACSFAELEELSGIPQAQMRAAAEVAWTSRRTICCWAMGLTQHKAAVATIQQVVNLLLLGGHVGRPGGGVCPVRGHSNVQGDRTMGIYENMDAAWLDRLGKRFHFTPPAHEGHNTVATIAAMRDGRVRVFFALGGNFLSATPDTEVTAAALQRCRLTVHVSTKLHRGHLIAGEQALILPCLGRTEIDVQASGPQFVSVENSMGIVHASRGHLPPAGPQLRSEVAIIAGVAEATLGRRSTVAWRELAGNYDRIRDHIEAVVPGFTHFNQRVRGADGFVLPNAARERVFDIPGGRARFTVHPLPRHDLRPGQLLMMTIRTHDQFNTTVYGLDDRYRGVYGGRHAILMNADDIAELGLRAGQRVDLTSHHKGQTRDARGFVVVPYPIPRRCAASYFPETNVLVPLDSYADKSYTPTSKSIVITVAPSAA